MTLYFGNPGSLVALTDPKGGLTMPRNVQRSTYALDAGGVRMSKSVSGRRTITLSYSMLPIADFVTLQAFEQGHAGQGPFAFWDTNVKNLLNVRQSSATSSTGDTSGFSILSGTGVLTSESAIFSRGPRSLGWQWPGAASGSQVLRLDPVSALWYGVPAVTGLAYTFSFSVRGGGSDSNIMYTAGLEWLGPTGSTLSISAGTSSGTSNLVYTQFFVTATAPAGTAYVRPRVTADGSSITNDAGHSLDLFQLEQGSAVTAWTPGTGLYPVDFGETTPDVYAWSMPEYRVGPVVTLQEVS